MDQQELIAALQAIIDTGVRRRAIEVKLQMPYNQLSGMLKGKRPIAPKWIAKLTTYVENHGTSKKEAVPIPKVEAVIETQPEPPKTKTLTSVPKKTPPAGMTKTQTIRWHRENNQTLL